MIGSLMHLMSAPGCCLLQGLVSKETIRGVYDGTWFYQQADKIKAEKAGKAPSNGRNGHQD